LSLSKRKQGSGQRLTNEEYLKITIKLQE